ncbi:MAG TPA: DUF6807 family protein [Microlunatus sp.]
MSEQLRTRATISDVADAAGVSRATVSRVMNNQASVNADLARRVREVADQLRYRPSNVARSLSLGRTQSIAVIVPDLGNPMFQGVVHGLTEAAALEGYRVMIIETDEDPTAEPTAAREARARCDAVVLVSPGTAERQLAELVSELQPAIVLGRGMVDHSGAPELAFDFASAVGTLADHLLGLGHRDLVYLNGPTSSVANVARLEGFDRVQADHPQLRIAQLSCGSRMADGYAAAERVLASRATAVIAYNDLVAFGLLARLNEIGVAVPQDLSVVGFDDIELAAYAVPPLTTVAVPKLELGRRAWEHLRARIHSESADDEPIFVPQLVRRASTGPVAPRRSARRRQPQQTVSSLAWHHDDQADVLMGDESLPLLRYECGDQMATVHSPRPYAHPVHTLAGVPTTTASPRDHRHQHGVSFAAPDVNGTTYWGGRTFLPDVGSTLLANHGRQVVVQRLSDQADAGAVLRERLRWEDEYGDTWLSEQRLLSGSLLPDAAGWALGWRSRLSADVTDITFASPATSGRHGAGYGGIFWRLDTTAVKAVFSELGSAEQAVHGRRTPWVAFVRQGSQGSTTVILQQPDDGEILPWFCRVSDYTGACPAIAWDAERRLPFGSSLELGLNAVLLDREVAPDEVPDLLATVVPPPPLV